MDCVAPAKAWRNVKVVTPDSCFPVPQARIAFSCRCHGCIALSRLLKTAPFPHFGLNFSAAPHHPSFFLSLNGGSKKANGRHSASLVQPQVVLKRKPAGTWAWVGTHSFWDSPGMVSQMGGPNSRTTKQAFFSNCPPAAMLPKLCPSSRERACTHGLLRPPWDGKSAAWHRPCCFLAAHREHPHRGTF
jgi:hypothetical protein